MHRQRLEALLERLRDKILARDVSGLVDFYATPVPFYHPNGLKVVVTAADLRYAVENFVAAMDDLDVSDVTIRVIETGEALRDSHFTAKVELRYFSEEGALLRQSKIRYFLDEGPHGLKIVMLEYLEGGFAEVLEEMQLRIS